MAQILFHQNVDLSGFNLGSNNIEYPNDQENTDDIDDATQNSILYSFVNNVLYNNNTLYGRYKSQALSRDKFILYKQLLNEDIKTYIATISNVTNGFYDYNINNGEQCKYIVETNPIDYTGVSNDTPSVSLETDYYINPNWNYWSICDIEKHYDVSLESGKDVYVPSDTVFIIKNNLNISAISDNLNIIKYNTLGKFGKTITNTQKYDSGTISCLISDFQAYQNISYNNKIFTVNDITNEKDIDLYFYNLKEKDKIEKAYFLFPNVSNTYYKYDSNVGKVTYIALSAEPNDWDDTFQYYYVLNNNTKQYVPVDYTYEYMSVKPDDWDTNYRSYYIPTADNNEDIYMPNDSNVWRDNYYYQQTIPSWSNNKYYRQVVSCITQVDTTNILMHTFDALREWRSCLSNGKLKLLKAPNGQSWIVSISDATQLTVNWNVCKYPASIDFNWQEVLDKDRISIIKW